MGKPLAQQPRQIVVDVHGADGRQFRLAEMVLQILEGILVVGVGGGLHLGAVVLIPAVGPLGKAHGRRLFLLFLFQLVVLDYLEDFPFGWRGEGDDDSLAGDGVVAVHQLSAPLSVGSLGNIPLPVCAFSCHGATSHRGHVGTQIWRDVGLHVHPGQEGLLGNADPAADAEDGKVLAVGQFVDSGLADTQIVADLTDGEVGLLAYFTHGRTSFLF